VLRGALDIAAASAVALTGESGSGKSTLLHLIAGLDAPMAATSPWPMSRRRAPMPAGGIAARPVGLCSSSST
jgi:ABC-type nitrate/sulfonate/bicarbonate transport system ATPase subunit